FDVGDAARELALARGERVELRVERARLLGRAPHDVFEHGETEREWRIARERGRRRWCRGLRRGFGFLGSDFLLGHAAPFSTERATQKHRESRDRRWPGQARGRPRATLRR